MKEQFELKKQHIKLLQNMCWEYSDCETGAPQVDCKRPYGNSYVPPDVAKILGVTLSYDDENQVYKDKVREIMQYHYDSHIALEIILQTKSFETGLYEKVGRDKHTDKNTWRKVK